MLLKRVRWRCCIVHEQVPTCATVSFTFDTPYCECRQQRATPACHRGRWGAEGGLAVAHASAQHKSTNSNSVPRATPERRKTPSCTPRRGSALEACGVSCEIIYLDGPACMCSGLRKSLVYVRWTPESAITQVPRLWKSLAPTKPSSSSGENSLWGALSGSHDTDCATEEDIKHMKAHDVTQARFRIPKKKYVSSTSRGSKPQSFHICLNFAWISAVLLPRPPVGRRKRLHYSTLVSTARRHSLQVGLPGSQPYYRNNERETCGAEGNCVSPTVIVGPSGAQSLCRFGETDASPIIQSVSDLPTPSTRCRNACREVTTTPMRKHTRRHPDRGNVSCALVLVF